METVRYRNLDRLDSFRHLLKKTPPDLADVLNERRVRKYEIETDIGKGERFFYNYSAKQVDENILRNLQDLAEEQQLIEKYRAIVTGEIMNTGEERRVLHHLARGIVLTDVIHEGKSLRQFYRSQQERIAAFCGDVRAARICTPAGRRFETVVQVGIGGSDLGPRALYLALQNYRTAGSLAAYFISNVDPDDAAEVLQKVDPETTLFILVSKSGTTQETRANENLILHYLRQKNIREPRKHIICITSETSPLASRGDYLAHFFINDFIGGRYSSTSAVGGAILSLALDPSIFAEILEGAAAADHAALETKLQNNGAMLDALIGVWERNVLNFPVTAILPYSQALSRFPAHLQQLDMESNGKQVNRRAEVITYATGPVIFGEPGTNGQHSFYQLLHQSNDIVPLQFIGFLQNQENLDTEWEHSTNRQKLNANLAAQITAFALGRKHANGNKNFPGGRPSSLLYAEKLSPRVLGALLSHFENKVMFQGLIWNINSFDQEGVQLGKVLTAQVLSSETLNGALLEFSRKLGLRPN
ncbi:MAG: glucose-6-phosphate isomerase [Salinispira sp.]